MGFPSCLSHMYPFGLCYTFVNQNVIKIAWKCSQENVKTSECWQLFEAAFVIQVKYLVCPMGKGE